MLDESIEGQLEVSHTQHTAIRLLAGATEKEEGIDLSSGDGALIMTGENLATKETGSAEGTRSREVWVQMAKMPPG